MDEDVFLDILAFMDAAEDYDQQAFEAELTAEVLIIGAIQDALA